MSSASNYLENKLADFMFRGQAFVPPSIVYIALYTATPSDAGGGTECSGSGYARAPMTCSLPAFCGTQGQGTMTVSSGTSGTIYNNFGITFPEPLADWTTCTHFGIFDAATSGNLLYWNVLTAPVTPTVAGGAVIILPNALSIQVDN